MLATATSKPASAWAGRGEGGTWIGSRDPAPGYPNSLNQDPKKVAVKFYPIQKNFGAKKQTTQKSCACNFLCYNYAMRTYKNSLPPTERLQHVFRYDPDTGYLYWRNPTHPNCTDGPIRTRGGGYLWVCIDGRHYTQHRIIWAIQTGSIPDDMEVDHINHVRDDNRWVNLQLLFPIDNQRKKPPKYKTRPLDQRPPRKIKIRQYASGNWGAFEWDHPTQKYKSLGIFGTRQEAESAEIKCKVTAC